jgi:hypothetical protein
VLSVKKTACIEKSPKRKIAPLMPTAQFLFRRMIVFYMPLFIGDTI